MRSEINRPEGWQRVTLARLHALHVGIAELELNAIEANARELVRVVHGACYSNRENER